MDIGNAVQLLFKAGLDPQFACDIIRYSFPQATHHQVECWYRYFLRTIPRNPRPIPYQILYDGYQAPPAVYQAPTVRYQVPPAEYQAPPGAYQAPTVWYQAPSGGYQAPPVEYQDPIVSYQAAPDGYQAPLAEYLAPPGAYQAPIVWYQALPAEYQAPSAEYLAPPAGYQAPSAEYLAPPAGYQAPIVRRQAPLTLFDLPVEITEIIFDKLTASELKTFKVSSSITLYRVNTDRVYFSVQLRLGNEKMQLLTTGSELKANSTELSLNIQKTFSKGKRSRDDENAGEPRQTSLYLFVDSAMAALKKAIDRPGVKIKKLVFSEDSSERINENIKKYCVEKLLQTMAGLCKPINVEQFEMQIPSTVPLRDFLTCLKAETLKGVNMDQTAVAIDMREIVALPHWPHLKAFFVEDVSNLSLESLLHLNSCIVYVPTITSTEIKDYKKKLLERQGWFGQDIYIRNDYPLADCLQQLEPYKQVGFDVGKGWLLRNSQERCYFALRNFRISFNSSRHIILS